MLWLTLSLILFAVGMVVTGYVLIMTMNKVLWPDTFVSRDTPWGGLLAALTFSVVMFWLAMSAFDIFEMSLLRDQVQSILMNLPQSN